MNAPLWPPQQQTLALALLDPRAAVPDFLVTRVGSAAASRFDVYRNNVYSSLIEALLATFPVTTRLVSEESFRAMARHYLRQQLPAGAALHDYGAGLPDFIRTWIPAAAVPYLADVAQLELLWWQSFGAAEAPAMSLRELATLDGEELLGRQVRLHPATRLMHSMHPVHAIWAAHQSPCEPAAPASWEPECVLVTRPGAEVAVRRITHSQHALLGALATGASLESAAMAAPGNDADFDLGTTLLLATEAGAIQELCS
jgi:hypothetical protein